MKSGVKSSGGGPGLVRSPVPSLVGGGGWSGMKSQVPSPRSGGSLVSGLGGSLVPGPGGGGGAVVPHIQGTPQKKMGEKNIISQKILSAKNYQPKIISKKIICKYFSVKVS